MSKKKIAKSCSRCGKAGHNVRTCKKKKQANQKPVEYYLYVLCKTDSEGGEICEGDEDEDFPNHEPEHFYTKFNCCVRNYDSNQISKNAYMWFNYKLAKTTEQVYNLDEVYISVVYYSSGGTFSSSTGNVCITDICATFEDAKKSLEYDLKDANSKKPQKYHPWTGYFESLERTEIIKLKVYDDRSSLVLALDNINDNVEFQYRDLT